MLSPYRTLPLDRRLALVTHDITSSPEAREAFIIRLLSKGGGFRRETLRKWPPTQLAREIVRANLEMPHDEVRLLQALYVELEPAIQITFLDATGVRHQGGSIPDDLPPPFADADAVSRAARIVADTHGADGRRYLATIALYNGDAWPGIEEAIGALG
ncbi:MAG: hypothetical protein ACKVZ0_22810 [Gemmatimonadales bacterium]